MSAAVTGGESGTGRVLEWRLRCRQEQRRVLCKLPGCNDVATPGDRERGKGDRHQTLDFSHIEQHFYCHLWSFAPHSHHRPNVGGYRDSSHVILSSKALFINDLDGLVPFGFRHAMELHYIDLQPQGRVQQNIGHISAERFGGDINSSFLNEPWTWIANFKQCSVARSLYCSVARASSSSVW